MKNQLKGIRIPENLIEKVNQIAEREDRNFSNMTTVLLKEALKARGIEI